MKTQDLSDFFTKCGYHFKNDQLLRRVFTTVEFIDENGFNYTRTKLESIGKLIMNDILKYYYINKCIQDKKEIDALEINKFITTLTSDLYLALRFDFLNLSKYLLTTINDNTGSSSVKASIMYVLFGAIFIDFSLEHSCDEYRHCNLHVLENLVLKTLNPREAIKYHSRNYISASYDRLKKYCLKNNVEVPELVTKQNGLEWCSFLLTDTWKKKYAETEEEAIDELSFLLHADLVIEDIIKRKEKDFKITLNNALDIYRELYYAGAFTDIMEFKNFNPDGVTEFVFRKTKYTGKFPSIGEGKRVLSYYILFYTLSAVDCFILDLDSNEDFYSVEIE